MKKTQPAKHQKEHSSHDITSSSKIFNITEEKEKRERMKILDAIVRSAQKLNW